MKATQLLQPAMRPAWQIPVAPPMGETFHRLPAILYPAGDCSRSERGKRSLRKWIPWFISVGQQHTDGSSNYNSFQASLTKGTSHGLYFTLLTPTVTHSIMLLGYESSGSNGRGINPFPGL